MSKFKQLERPAVEEKKEILKEQLQTFDINLLNRKYN